VNLDFLKQVLAVPTQSLREDQMVQFITNYAATIPNTTVAVDRYNNVVIKRGTTQFYPCISAHIDSVQPIERKYAVEQMNGFLVGIDTKGSRVGFGADDKTGVYICLEMLRRFDTIAVAFFSAEEIGCQGASKIDPKILEDVGYLIEFDCPAHDMMSYTSGGERLFANHDEFIKTALPILHWRGISKWQNHPYSDVMAIRRRFDFSCLNLSSGYYNWHQRDELVKIEDTANSLEMAEELVRALGEKQYTFRRGQIDESAPIIELSKLIWPVP
jgi:putative aminopeptidase FrvX